MPQVLDREEYIEQAYFFRTLRERMIEERIPTQIVLERIHEEILAITRLPMAIQFLSTELCHLRPALVGFRPFVALLHAVPFQAFVVAQAEGRSHAFQHRDRTPGQLEPRGGVSQRHADRAGALRLSVRDAESQSARV